MFTGITDLYSYLYNGFKDIGMSPAELIICIFIYLIPLAVYDYLSQKKDVIALISSKKPVVRHFFYGIIVAVIVFFHAIGEVSFVYFQF